MKNESIGKASPVNLTDWAKVSALTDAEIICDDDSPATTEADWSGAFVCKNAEQLHFQTHNANNNTLKEQVAIGYDVEILERFRATGKGWQTRMNDALKEWLNQHPDFSRI